MKKTTRRPKNSLRALEKARKARIAGCYELRLFVTGSTPRSMDAIARIKEVCEAELKNRYTLDVVDVHQEPELLVEDQIFALPTLIKKLPLPLRKMLGGFSDKERLLAVLGLTPIQKAK